MGALNRNGVKERLTIQPICAPVERYSTAFHPTVQKALSPSQAMEKSGQMLAEAGLGNFIKKFPGEVSSGMARRAEIVRALINNPKVLLLDEPTNDLDVNTLRALEEGLENFAGCAVVISHDRWFLDRICTHILAFEGDSQVYFFEGSYSDYEENKKKRLGQDLMPKRIQYRKLTRN